MTNYEAIKAMGMNELAGFLASSGWSRKRFPFKEASGWMK